MSADPVSLAIGGGLVVAVVAAAIVTALLCLPLILGLFYLLGAASVQVVVHVGRRVQSALGARPNE